MNKKKTMLTLSIVITIVGILIAACNIGIENDHAVDNLVLGSKITAFGLGADLGLILFSKK